MATLERINIVPMVPELSNRKKGISWLLQDNDLVIAKVPHIFFSNGEPWLAANRYALNKLESFSGNDLKTVISNMNHLKAYACWLEDNKIDWRHFPRKKKDRCLFRYRGFLIQQRDKGMLRPSTATARMGAIVRFYRWAQISGFIEQGELWGDKTKTISFYTSIGFSRTMNVVSSELSIPNRQRTGIVLEDGLLPLSVSNINTLLRFLKDREMYEIYLMTKIGFLTGARSETIRTLRISTITNSIDDPVIKEIRRVAVGPGTQVKTKYNVNGSLAFPTKLIQELEEYATSIRRYSRQAKATQDNQCFLFLTERGNSYSETSFTKLISYLREKLVCAELFQFKEFKFHQTRATYGTQLMRIALDTLPSQNDAIVFVRDAMLHKDDSTTWKYVKFIEQEPIKESLSNEFFNLFIGFTEDKDRLISKVTYE